MEVKIASKFWKTSLFEISLNVMNYTVIINAAGKSVIVLTRQKIACSSTFENMFSDLKSEKVIEGKLHFQ